MQLSLRLCTGFIALSMASVAGAHVTGQTLEKTVGNYLVDIGYNTQTKDVIAGDTVLFDVSLTEHTGGQWQYALYDTVWIQLTADSTEPVRKVVSLDLPGPATLSYHASSGGNLILSVRFLSKDQVLAETSFPLIIEPKEVAQGTAKTIALSLFGAFFLFVIGTMYLRRMQPASGKRTHPSRRTRRRTR